MAKDIKKRTITVDLDIDLIDAIDERAKDVGLSRTEWISRCSRWAVHNLPDRMSGTDPATKQKFADSAPPEVAGHHSVDMGLDR